MINARELFEWLSVRQDKYFAIDEGGLTLIEIYEDGKTTGIELEIGGVPTPEDDDR